MPYANQSDRRAAQKRYYQTHKDEAAQAQRKRRGVPDYDAVEPTIITEGQIAWLAGLYEGEGSCTLWQPKIGGWHCGLTIGMTDHDVIQRIQTVTKVGKIYSVAVRDGCKPAWHWKVTRREQIVALIEGMWPYLHERRREQLTPLLEHCKVQLQKRLPTYKGYVNLQIQSGTL